MLLLTAGRWLYPVFTDDPAVVSAAVMATPVVVAAVPIMVWSMVLAGVLRAASDTVTIMRATLIGSYAVQLPVALLLGITLRTPRPSTRGPLG